MSVSKLENDFTASPILLHFKINHCRPHFLVGNTSSYGVKHWNYSVQDCDAVQTYSNVPKLRTNLLPPYSSPKTETAYYNKTPVSLSQKKKSQLLANSHYMLAQVLHFYSIVYSLVVYGHGLNLRSIAAKKCKRCTDTHLERSCEFAEDKVLDIRKR
jgi:hypothetical protein